MRYQHIGVLYADANRNGILDEDDTVIHAGFAPLHFSKLKNGFNGEIIIVRPNL